MVTEEIVSRGDIFLVALNPTRGTEIVPLLLLLSQPADIHILFVCVASLLEKTATLWLDQLRAVDRDRLVKRLGLLSKTTLDELLGVLQAMFAA